MDNKVLIKCLSNTCRLKVYTRLSKKCSHLQGDEYFWTGNDILVLNFTGFIISCIEVIGSYEIQSGGVGFDFAYMKCLSNKCVASIFKEVGKKCLEGNAVVVKNWTKKHDFQYSESKMKVVCMEVLGRYDRFEEEGVVHLRCYSLYCLVALFANTSFQKECEKTEYNLTEVWDSGTPFELILEKGSANRIACFSVSGSYELISGGIDQNHLVLKCYSVSCEVVVHMKKNIHHLRARHNYNKVVNMPVFVPHREERVHEVCPNMYLQTNKTWNSSIPLYVVSSKKISCLKGSGLYEIISGGEGFNSLVAKCSDVCYLEVYVPFDKNIFHENCDNFTLYISKEWNNHNPLVLNMKQQIGCFEVEGDFSIISGGIGSTSLVAECLEEGFCKLSIYVEPEFRDQFRVCQGYRLLLRKKWGSQLPLVVNLPNYITIDCFIVEGNYTVIAGGTKSNSMILECTADRCIVEIYNGRKVSSYLLISQVDNCSGKFLESKCWDRTKTFSHYLNQNNHAIFCINISGDYIIKSGGIGHSYIEVECQEVARDCCISIYLNTINLMNSLNYNRLFIDEPIDASNCSFGSPEVNQKWKFGSSELITLSENSRIVCVNVIGAYKVKKGGIGTNFIEMECHYPDGCQAELYSVKSGNRLSKKFPGTLFVIILVYFSS